MNYNLLGRTLLFIALLIIETGCKKESKTQPDPLTSETVEIEGNEYPSLVIGDKIWTTKNYAGPGGINYDSIGTRPEYGKYYTFHEIEEIKLPKGWRLPRMQDFMSLAANEGITFSNNRAINQEPIKRLASTRNWRTIPGSNASGFDAQPAGYCFKQQPPLEGDIAEFWTVEGYTFSIQETAGGKTHRIVFYSNGSSPEYRFNLRFVRDR